MQTENLPIVQWDQLFSQIANSEEQERVAQTVNVSNPADASTTRCPPDVNTILRILGPWLFDACLNRKTRFATCRMEAVSCLGKIISVYCGGRSKRIHWAYGIRSLMALQAALNDEDGRINAAAIYSRCKVLGMYGNHTLRGAGAITGAFHKAVERILRMEKRDLFAAAGSKTSEEIDGVPYTLLRRACIEACGSLLTLHSHLPVSFWSLLIVSLLIALDF